MTTFLILLGILFYIAGMACFIDDRVTITYWNKTFHCVDHIAKEITPRDVRLSILWPIFLLWHVFKVFLFILNELFSFICLFIGYRYKKSIIYYRINAFLDI